MSLESGVARAGVEYRGEFLLHVFRTGTARDLSLFGNGWEILEFDRSLEGQSLNPGTYRLPFRAIPRSADEPIGLRFDWEGRYVRRAYEIGPRYFDNVGARHALIKTAPSKFARERGNEVETDAPHGQSGSGSVAGDAIPLRATGRIAYTRRGIDNSVPPDGDTNDPGDVPPVIVGVDGVLVRLIDDDDIDSEIIWSGLTDVNGYFDSGVVQWDDCDIVCDTPDILIEFDLDNGVVDVTDSSILEETYSFSTEEITDFAGSFYDFGILMPGDANLFPALHIFNSMVRTERFIRTRTPFDPPHVQVEWPDGDSGAFYDAFADEIHIGTDRQWREDTHAHEFGHHFLSNFSNTIEPDYCNGLCDADTPCAFDNDCEDPGHCLWCEETDHDAWNEGFPNWLADIVTRSFPEDYQFDDGTPFTVLFPRSQESLGTCCLDGLTYSPLRTEGFLGSLLRDIEDDTQDDHDGDGIRDSLCLGIDEIFHTVTTFNPTTPELFLLAFLALYPEHATALWATAFNVGGADYVANFPADVQAPGAVTALSSPSHPLGVGDPLPCVVVEWDHAPDDVQGACEYSYEWSNSPSGIEPDETEELDVDYSGCRPSVTAAFPIGTYYFSIKAMDCTGKWSSDWSTFGPFEVTDCNGNGLTDLCDISCNHTGYSGCNLAPTWCTATGCGMSADCQPNLVPDECDIAEGTSEDCNLSGSPDECETVYHWANTGNAWNAAESWEENELPVVGSDVCIDVPGDEVSVLNLDAFDIDILACEESLELFGAGFPRPELTLREPSWIRGDLILHGSLGVLNVEDRLDIEGTLMWTGTNNSNVMKLAGSGSTHIHGSLDFVGVAPFEGDRLVLEPGTMSTTSAWFLCPQHSTFEIRPGAVLDHQSETDAFSQCWTDLLIIGGTLIRSAPGGNSWFDIPTENNGLIHVQGGTMSLSRTSTHTGQVLADPGAIFRLMGGGHDFLSTSSIEAERVEFTNHIAGSNFIRGTYDVSDSTDFSAGVTMTFTDEANIVNYAPEFIISRGTVNFDAPIGDMIHFDVLALGGGTFGGTANFNSGDPVEVDVLTMGPGTLRGEGTITVNEQFTWNQSSTIWGPGVLDIIGDSTIGAGGGQKTLYHRTMNNYGTMIMNGGFEMLGDATLTNHAGGTIDIRVDSGGSVIGSGFGFAFDNQGTLVKSAGTGNSNITSAVTNSGTVEIQVGEIQFNKQFIQTAGSTFFNGGGFYSWFPSQFIPDILFEGGEVTGSGAFTGNQPVTVRNEGAIMRPGTSVGTIHIEGEYIQAAGGVLEIEVQGGAANEFDRLIVTAAVTLAGELNVMVDPMFDPPLGTIIVFLEASEIIGQFDAENIPLPFEIRYKDQDVRLIVPLPGDLDENGFADLRDWADLMLCFAGSGNTPAATCSDGIHADLDNDGDVDLDDATVVILAMQ